MKALQKLCSNNLVEISLFILGTLFAFLSFRGMPPFLGDATYLDLNATTNLLNGNGYCLGPFFGKECSLFAKRPMGYSLMIILPTLIGFSLVSAGKIISALMLGVTGLFTSLILKEEGVDERKRFFLTLFGVVLFVPYLKYSNIIAPEIGGVAFLVMSWAGMQKILKGESHRYMALLIGVCIGWLVWLRLANAIFVLPIGLAFLIRIISRENIDKNILALIFTGITCLSLAAVNYSMTGNFAGHPTNVGSTNPFFIAVFKSVDLTFLGMFFGKLKFIGRDLRWALVIIAILYFAYEALKSYRSQKLFRATIFISPLLYLLFFSYIQSKTTIDDVGSRYILPLNISLMLSVLVFFSKRVMVFGPKKIKRYGIILFICLSVTNNFWTGRIFMNAKYSDQDYSPITNKYIIDNINKGSPIISGRYLKQLFLDTIDYPLLALPFYSKYNEAYGRKLKYTREEFLGVVRKHRVRHLVFFYGEDKRERFLERKLYGNYFSNLKKSDEYPEIKNIIELKDGKIFELNL